MSKETVHLSREEVEALPGHALSEAPDGVIAKLLSRDERAESWTQLLVLRDDATIELGDERRMEEAYVVAGELRGGGATYGPGSYLCRPPASGGVVLTATGEAEVLHIVDAEAGWDKPAVDLPASAIETLPWEQKPDGTPGLAHQRILARGRRGSFARLLRLEGATPSVAEHTYHEDVLILEGSATVGDELHAEGTYTFNEAGTPHGPFAFDGRLLCVEFGNQPA